MRPHADGPCCEVVSLRGFRHAVRARAFMLGVLHSPPWLAAVRVAILSGDPVLVIEVTDDDEMVRRCLPSGVDGTPVLVQVVL